MSDALPYEKNAEDLLDFEWKRYDRLSSQLAQQINHAVAIGGGIIYVLKSTKCLQDWTTISGFWQWATAVLLCSGVVCFFVQVWFLFQAWRGVSGYGYDFFPPPMRLKGQWDGILEHFKHEKNDGVPTTESEALEKTKRAYESRIRDMILRAAQQNYENNDKKTDRLYIASGAMFIAIPLVVLSFVASNLAQSPDVPTVRQVRIIKQE